MAREWHGRRERRGSHLAATAPSSTRGWGLSAVTTASWASREGGAAGGFPLGCEQPSLPHVSSVPLDSAFVALDSQDASTASRPVSPVLGVIDHPGRGFG